MCFGVIALVVSGCKKDPNTYMLTVNVSPAEAGVVVISPELSVYEEGTKVTLTAASSEGYSFTNWLGDYTGASQTIEVVMSKNISIEAIFSKLSYTLNLAINPSEGGVIEVSPASDGTYEHGTVVTLSAKPAVGYFFSQWQGDATGDAETIEIVMNQDKTIEGSFSVGLKEDFEDNEVNNFLNDESGRWSVNDKAYYLNGTGSNTWGYSWYNFTDFDNFEYSVDIKATGNTYLPNAVGIYFRSASGDFFQNSYWFSITFDGRWNFIKIINNETIWLKEWTLSDMINTGLDQTNTLKVRCVGSTIELFVNDISYGVFTDADFSAGYIGVGGYDVAGYNNTYVFDNISLKAVEETPTKSGLILTPREQNTTGMDPRFSN